MNLTISKYRKFILIAILAFILGMFSLIIIANMPLQTYDYWWHLKAGEWIVQNKHVPVNDIFSWYGIENELNWTSHEWLSEIFIYGMENIFGVNYGGYLFCSVFILLLFISLFLFNKKHFMNNMLFTLIWVMSGAVILIYFVNPRPFLIGWILFAYTIYLCESLRKNENSKKIYFLPLISILWSNFHGGSSNLVYIIPLCYLVPNLFNIKWYKLKTNLLTKKQTKKYAINIIISILALIINPHGLYMIIYPYVNMADATMQNYINEWGAIDLKNHLYIGLLIFSIFFIGIFTKKDLEVTDCILLFFFIILSFRSIRFVAMLYIVASFYLIKYVKPFHCSKQSNISWYMRNLPLIMLITGIELVAISVATMIEDYDMLKVEPLISDEVIEKIKENNYKRIYNTYSVGGYLIYNDIKVFIDGRADMYSKNIFEASMKWEFFSRGIDEEFKSYNFDAFVIEKSSPIYNYFNSVDYYKLVVEDENISVYEMY